MHMFSDLLIPQGRLALKVRVVVMDISFNPKTQHNVMRNSK